MTPRSNRRPTPVPATPAPVRTPAPTPTLGPARHCSAWTPVPVVAPGPTATPGDVYAARRADLPRCPQVAHCRLYQPQDGEYLILIARRFGVRIDALLRLNPALPGPSEPDAPARGQFHIRIDRDTRATPPRQCAIAQARPRPADPRVSPRAPRRAGPGCGRADAAARARWRRCAPGCPRRPGGRAASVLSGSGSAAPPRAGRPGRRAPARGPAGPRDRNRRGRHPAAIAAARVARTSAAVRSPSMTYAMARLDTPHAGVDAAGAHGIGLRDELWPPVLRVDAPIAGDRPRGHAVGPLDPGRDDRRADTGTRPMRVATCAAATLFPAWGAVATMSRQRGGGTSFTRTLGSGPTLSRRGAVRPREGSPSRMARNGGDPPCR